MKKEQTYLEMLAEVEAILDRLGRSPVDVDHLAAEVKRAEELITLCRQRLLRADGKLSVKDGECGVKPAAQ